MDTTPPVLTPSDELRPNYLAAGSFAYEVLAFEVKIDTATFALPVVVNSKSGGEGLMK